MECHSTPRHSRERRRAGSHGSLPRAAEHSITLASNSGTTLAQGNAAGCPCIGRDRVYRQRGERFRQRGAPNRRPGHTDEAQVRADSSPQGPMNGRSAAAPAARRHETLEPGGCGGDRSSDGGWTAPDPGRRLSAPYRKRGRTASVPRPALQDRTALGAGWIRTEPVFAVSVHRR